MLRQSGQNPPISPLAQDDVTRVRLPWYSCFSRAALSSHLAEHPGLAFWNPATGEYGVGGYWRGRRDIGMVVEVSRGASQAPLVDRLVSRFREEGFRAVVLSQDEADRAVSWYQEHGWGLLDRLLAFRLSLDRPRIERERFLLVSSFQPQEP